MPFFRFLNTFFLKPLFFNFRTIILLNILQVILFEISLILLISLVFLTVTIKQVIVINVFSCQIRIIWIWVISRTLLLITSFIPFFYLTLHFLCCSVFCLSIIIISILKFLVSTLWVWLNLRISLHCYSVLFIILTFTFSIAQFSF